MSIWRAIATTIARAFGFASAGSALLLGGGSGGTQVSPGYPSEWSMSTLARFPWVWTCVRAVAGDLAGLPLVAVKRAPGGSRRAGKRTLVDDRALALLDQPSSGVTGYLLRKQLAVDWLTSGNAYGWRPTEFEVIRLHPSVVKPITRGVARTIVSYEVCTVVDGRVVQFSVPPSQMLHIRDVSWSPDADSVLGESPIRCLHEDLTMEAGSKTRAAEQAKRGRPDILFSSEKGLGDNLKKEAKERWEDAILKGDGAFFVGRDLKATVLSWNPREFDFKERSEIVRDTVLAVFEVPPARAGLSSANYGTQKQQMRTYWESLVRRAQAFNDAFSLLAGPGVRIEHDFSEVEALQVSYTERQMRVQTWVSLGATPAQAAEYEGFDDAPVGDEPLSGVQPGLRMPSKPEEPQGDKTSPVPLEVALVGYFTESVTRYEAIATAASNGADTTFLERWETERLYGLLERLADATTARAWADDIVGATVEATRAGLTDGHNPADLAAFSTERAGRLARRMRMAA